MRCTNKSHFPRFSCRPREAFLLFLSLLSKSHSILWGRKNIIITKMIAMCWSRSSWIELSENFCVGEIYSRFTWEPPMEWQKWGWWCEILILNQNWNLQNSAFQQSKWAEPYLPFVVPHPSVTSPLISTIWCFRPYKPYSFCEDIIQARCHCHHIQVWWWSYYHLMIIISLPFNMYQNSWIVGGDNVFHSL